MGLLTQLSQKSASYINKRPGFTGPAPTYKAGHDYKHTPIKSVLGWGWGKIEMSDSQSVMASLSSKPVSSTFNDKLYLRKLDRK